MPFRNSTRSLAALASMIAALGAAPGTVHASYGGADIDVITGGETSPHVTQNEAWAWGHGSTVVVAYNDSSGTLLSPVSACAASVSTDGGATFTRLPYRFNADGHPSVFYSVRAGKWYYTALASRCGNPGVAQWVSPDGVSWAEGACVARVSYDDLPSSWVDNNPNSPFYGRQYVLYNDFDLDGGAPRLTYSVDDGATWSPPVTIIPAFQRAVGVTGSLGADGTVFVETLDEGGGGLDGPRQNFIYRSTDGGATFGAAIPQGPAFLGPGRSFYLYFPGMYYEPYFGYWIQLGFGQLGVGPDGVVHYVYVARTATPYDPGNIYYVRSTDNGVTWSAPLQLNTDTTARAQWGPSLCVNSHGGVFVSWYDERDTTTDSLERFRRVSIDNGATWGTDMAVSDVVFPKPLQPDPNYSSRSVGIREHAAFSDDGTGTTAYATWTDGRVSIDGAPQQDVFFDKLEVVPLHRSYVKETGDDTHGGSSWADAKRTITAALNLTAGPGAEVWVATGNYPGGFEVPAGITLYGGFTGTETLLTQRSAGSRSTISGPGTTAVVRFRSSSGNGIDGFKITRGGGLPVTINSTSRREGGGIYIGNASPRVANNLITDNSANLGGGISANGGRPVITGNTITLNTATATTASPGLGGGVAITGNGCTLQDNFIVSNTATGATSGNVGSGAAALVVGGTADVHNNTFAGNQSTIGQGDISIASGDTAFVNNIIANHAAIEKIGGSPTFSHNDYVPGAAVTHELPGINGTNGNISNAVTFVNAASGNYHLPQDSPLKDLGDLGAISPGETDVDLEPRVMGPGVDIGADEVALPYTFVDAVSALRIAGGLQPASPIDELHLDWEGDIGVDVTDTLRLARKLAGLDPNP